MTKHGEVEALGMTYIALPISGKEDIGAANAQALHALLQGREGKVLLHCASGNRVGALLALGAAQIDGLPADDALALGRAAGLKSLEPVVVEQLATPTPTEPR
ncbi:MAG: sulfur transferase domain-containing protein [Pseudoxanthomonas sp.]